MEWFKQFAARNRCGLIGASIGVVIAALMLIIGFFPTLLLLLFGGVGALIGACKPVRDWLKRLFGVIYGKIFRNSGGQE